MNLDVKVKELVTNIKNKMNKFNLELVKNASKLDSLSPLKTLSRGYSITEKDGKIVKKAANLKKDDKVSMRFTDGSVEAKVL